MSNGFHDQGDQSGRLPDNPFLAANNMKFQTNLAEQHNVAMQQKHQSNMQQQIVQTYQLALDQQNEMRNFAHSIHEQIDNINNTMQQYTQVTDTTKKEFIRDQQQIVSLQKQIQYIALQVHRLHHVSKMDILDQVRDFKMAVNVKDYSSMLDKYRVASSYLMMQMEPKLFVYVSKKRRTSLVNSKQELRSAKHDIGELDSVTDKLTGPHLNGMKKWHAAMQKVEKCENSNYEFASRRRIQMKGAETLSTELANLLDYKTKSGYNNARNELQRKEDEFDTGDKNQIQTLKAQLDTWRDNLQLLFLSMKYTRHMSKTNNIQKAIHGKGLSDEERKAYHTAQSTFIMSVCDEHLLHLIEEDALMGQSWIKDPSASNENTPNLDEIEKSKIHKALLAQLPEKQSGEGQDKTPREITLTEDAWKECGIRILYPDTKIKVEGGIFTPKGAVTISQMVMRKDDDFQEPTKKLLNYYRSLHFSSYLSDKAPAFEITDKPGH